MNQRIPVAISLNQGTIVTTGGSTTFAPGSARDAMESYLRLVRRMRSQRRAPSVSLRQRDIDAMAIDLRMPAETLVDDLQSLMAETRSRLPHIGGTAVIGAAAVVALAVAAPAITNRLSDNPAQTNNSNTKVNGNTPAAPALKPSSGVYISPTGEEIDVTFGGAPAPPPGP